MFNEELPAILSVVMMAIIFLAALLLDNRQTRRFRANSPLDSAESRNSIHQQTAHPLPQQPDLRRG